jgi:cytochrome c-type biogenesis protein CcmE
MAKKKKAKLKIKHKQQRFIFIASVFFVSSVSLWFIIDNFKKNLLFFYAPTEFWQANNDKQIKAQKNIRVGGLVKLQSIIKIDSLHTKFIITDNLQELNVVYQGLLPDLFREEQGVIAKGIFSLNENIFFASELLIKHDEKYMPPEVAKTLKSKK